MQLERERADEPGVLRRMAVRVRKGRPVVLAGRVRLDEHEVPVSLGVAVDPEREVRAAGGHGDRALEPLVGRLALLRDRVLAAAVRLHLHVEVRVDGVPEADAVRGVRVELELAHGSRRQVRGHRLLRLPAPGGPAVPRPGAVEHAVGDCLEPLRHRDLEGVGRLVARVVVDRVPRRGHVRLADDERAVVRVDEACALDGLGDAAVADDDLELAVLADAVRRGDRQLMVVAAPRCVATVHLHAVHREADEVEVELREALRRLRADRRLAAEDVRVGVVLHLQEVVPNVVAAVSVEGEVRVPRPGGAGLELASAASHCLCCRRREGQHQADRQREHHCAARTPSVAEGPRSKHRRTPWVGTGRCPPG